MWLQPTRLIATEKLTVNPADWVGSSGGESLTSTAVLPCIRLCAGSFTSDFEWLFAGTSLRGGGVGEPEVSLN